MLSLGQKLIAISTILFLELVALLLFLPIGLVGLFFAIPLVILILKR